MAAVISRAELSPRMNAEVVSSLWSFSADSSMGKLLFLLFEVDFLLSLVGWSSPQRFYRYLSCASLPVVFSGFLGLVFSDLTTPCAVAVLGTVAN